MNEPLLLTLGLGLLLGLKHATEADHVVAVSAIVSERRSVLRSALVGAWWGVGHTLSLLAAGALVILLRVRITEQAGAFFEFAVAVMIILLGARVLFRLFGETRRDAHSIRTNERTHADAHAATRGGWRPLLVGMIHGLAGGSGVLALLPLAVVGASPALGFLYLLLFGAGSILGMLLMSLVVGLPFVLTAERAARFNAPVRLLAGLLSIAFGFFYAWETAGGLR